MADFGTMESEIKKFLDDNGSNHDLGQFGEELAAKITSEYEKAVLSSSDDLGNAPMSVDASAVEGALIQFFKGMKEGGSSSALVAPIITMVMATNAAIVLPQTNATPGGPDSDPAGMSVVVTYLMGVVGPGTSGDYTDAFPGEQAERTTAVTAQKITKAFENQYLDNATVMAGTLPNGVTSAYAGALS